MDRLLINSVMAHLHWESPTALVPKVQVGTSQGIVGCQINLNLTSGTLMKIKDIIIISSTLLYMWIPTIASFAQAGNIDVWSQHEAVQRKGGWREGKRKGSKWLFTRPERLSPDMAWICKGVNYFPSGRTHAHDHTHTSRVESLLLNITAGAGVEHDQKREHAVNILWTECTLYEWKCTV